MDSVRPPYGSNRNDIAQQTLGPAGELRNSARPPARSLACTSQNAPRNIGFGLPCADCRTYYAADLTVCPICRSTERISAGTPDNRHRDPQPVEESATALEVERERFLREFKSQLNSSHRQINAAASFRCNLEENHLGTYEPAEVCQSCYMRVQEQRDRVEAALHIDLQDASQIIYDAVWADPSDSSKTYQNAAYALLSELRRRAGIALVLGPNQALPH